MAEFPLSKILGQLPKINSKLQEEIKLIRGVESAVADLSSKLTVIRSQLTYAEKTKLNETNIGIWLEKLEDVAYEMDDLLDEWNIEIHRIGVEAAENSAPTSTPWWEPVRLCILSYCLCYKEVSVRRKIALKIVECYQKISSILTEAKDFEFAASHSNSVPQLQEPRRPSLTTSYVDEREVHGRPRDKNAIFDKLTLREGSSEGEDRIPVVSILGAGGIGKTTVAQSVFNDHDRLKEHFELKLWVCVSDPYDEKRILKEILEGIENCTPNVSELEPLFQRLRKSTRGRKFLLVLDDVWTEDYERWKQLVGFLSDGAPGSRILLTTRKEAVARMVNSCYIHRLERLHDLDCWSIIKRRAFTRRSGEERFGEIAWEIAKRCKGLALAATFLGNLMRSKDPEEWQDVLNSPIWTMEDAKKELFPYLYFSYKELSPEEKRCFSYCAVFPKDTKINVERLIRIWTALGYLGSNTEVGKLEKMGSGYFDDLKNLSFFQDFQWHNNKVITCKMHDIVHDFAQFLVQNECAIIGKLEGKVENFPYDKTRHLAWLDKPQGLSDFFRKVTKLRSFYGPTVPPIFFSCVKALRVLDLRHCKLHKLAKELGYLIHLRFLDLSRNPLEELPEALCDLYNLETLYIERCNKLIRLPEQIGNLVNLRYLLNEKASNIQQFPEGFAKLSSLQVLTLFRVGRGQNNLGCLAKLNQLQGSLKIEVDGHVDDEDDLLDFGKAELNTKTALERLSLSFKQKNMKNRGKYINTLKPPPYLSDFQLYNYPNTKLPRWIFTSLKGSLRKLILSDCSSTSLADLGKLPSLEMLHIFGHGVVHLGLEFLGITTAAAEKIIEKSGRDLDNEIMEDGTSSKSTCITSSQQPAEVYAFPRLRILNLVGMPNLMTWEDLREEEDNASFVVMPHLQELFLTRCKKLQRLPHRILSKASSLKRLALNDCHALEQRYNKETGQDWTKISHIRNVEI